MGDYIIVCPRESGDLFNNSMMFGPVPAPRFLAQAGIEPGTGFPGTGLGDNSPEARFIYVLSNPY